MIFLWSYLALYRPVLLALVWSCRANFYTTLPNEKPARVSRFPPPTVRWYSPWHLVIGPGRWQLPAGRSDWSGRTRIQANPFGSLPMASGSGAGLPVGFWTMDELLSLSVGMSPVRHMSRQRSGISLPLELSSVLAMTGTAHDSEYKYESQREDCDFFSYKIY